MEEILRLGRAKLLQLTNISENYAFKLISNLWLPNMLASVTSTTLVVKMSVPQEWRNWWTRILWIDLGCRWWDPPFRCRRTWRSSVQDRDESSSS